MIAAAAAVMGYGHEVCLVALIAFVAFTTGVCPVGGWFEDATLFALLLGSGTCVRAFMGLGEGTKQTAKSLPDCKTAPCLPQEAPCRPLAALKRVWQRRRLLAHAFQERFERALCRLVGLHPHFDDQPCAEDFHHHPQCILPIEVVEYRSSSIELGLWMPKLMRPRDDSLCSILEDEILDLEAEEVDDQVWM